MKKERRLKAGVAVIYTACAVLWTANVAMDLTAGDGDTALLVLHLICAVLWSVAAVLQWKNYKKSGKTQE